MDHFLIPKGAEHIEVPYICHETFDGAYGDYPERQGWTEHELKEDAEFGSRPPQQVAAFFQNYLFFGILREVFQIVEVKWDINDFIIKRHAEHFVSTAALPAIIKKWSSQAEALTTVDKQNALHAIYLLMGGLHWEFVNKRFNHFSDYIKSSGDTVCEWPVIALSISALGWTFEVAAHKIYGAIRPPGDGPEKWGSVSVLETRMLEAGWSRGEITNYARQFCIDGLYYFGSLESPRKHQHCQNCLDPKCTRKRLTDDGYVTQHAKGCAKDCQIWDVSEKALEIVRNGKTPLVTWKDSKLTVLESDLKDMYLAISHVWSDGMGNPTRNALPACQLSRIQEFVNKLYSHKRKTQKRHQMIFGPRNSLGKRDPAVQPVGFWMDTLCVPVKDDEARKQAIRKMRNIYELADRVLVLDSWTQALSRSADIIEKACRLYLSNWQSRLWTLQESVLAHGLFIQFKDGPQTLESMQKDLQEAERSRSELRYYCTLGLTLYLVPLFALQLQRTPTDAPSEVFLALVGGVVTRTTTKRSDETICLSTILALDPAPLLDIPGKKERKLTEEEELVREQQACEKRMQKFLEMVGGFEQGIVFSDLPRLKSEGFGWAPKSFLDQPGLQMPESIHPFNSGKAKMASVKPNGQGLLVTCPGILLTGVRSDLGCTVVVRQDAEFWCTVTLKPEDAQEPNWDLDPALQYAIISNDHIDRKEAQEQSEAILGILLGEDEEGHPKLRYFCRAKVQWWAEDLVKVRMHLEGFILEEPNKDQTVSGEWLDDQKWCLV